MNQLVYVDPEADPDATEPMVVALDEFMAAKADPKVHRMLDFANAYGERLEREGRNH
jgi:hypothetical protein